MGIGNLDLYAPMETALNGVGFKVDKIEKQGKKTVITVSRGETPDVCHLLEISGCMPGNVVYGQRGGAVRKGRRLGRV
jgi:hypothetical protein